MKRNEYTGGSYAANHASALGRWVTWGRRRIWSTWRGCSIRGSTIGPIRMSEALTQVAVAPLLEVARGECLTLAIQAAWALAGRAERDDELRGIVSRWPADAPYPASEVRELLGME